MEAKLGIAPIAWWNDDLPELSGDITLEQCLADARHAGFTGMETGRRFPMDPKVLGPIMEAHGMRVCGGWFCGCTLAISLTPSGRRSVVFSLVRSLRDRTSARGASGLH